MRAPPPPSLRAATAATSPHRAAVSGKRGRDSRATFVAALLALMHVCGCALLRSPPPPPLPAREVVQAIRARTEQIQTVKDSDASVRIFQTVKGKLRRLPSLGGLVGFDRRWPALYIVAEKFGQTAFWLRATAEGFWLRVPRYREVLTGGPAAYRRLPQMVRPEEVRSFFGTPEALGLDWPGTEFRVLADTYVFDVRLFGFIYRQVVVDRRELTVRAIRQYDSLGRLTTQVLMSAYRRADGVLLPRRITVSRPLVGVRVELRLGEPKLNAAIKPEAFLPGPVPPDWKHVDLDREPLSESKLFGGES